MSTTSVKTRQDIIDELANKAWENDRFKQDLIRSPKETLAHHFGIGALPDNIKITVLEETPTQIYIVIPAKAVGTIHIPAGGTACRSDTHWTLVDPTEIDQGRPGEFKSPMK